METLIIEAENQKIKALKALLTAFGVNYRVAKKNKLDTTEYLLKSKKNRKSLMESIQELKSGDITQKELVEIWISLGHTQLEMNSLNCKKYKKNGSENQRKSLIELAVFS